MTGGTDGAADADRDVAAIDDDPVFLALVRRRLRGSGLSLATFASSADALEALRGSCARLVLVDLHIGGESGLELLATLRAERRLDGARACVVTASVPEEAVVAEVGRLGAEILLKEDALAEGALVGLLRGPPAGS